MDATVSTVGIVITDTAAAASAGARAAVASAVGAAGLELHEHHVDAVLWVAAAVVAIATFGHVLAGVPLKWIGQNTGGGVRTRLFGYDNSRGELPRAAAFVIVLFLGMAAFQLLRPWPLVFFALAIYLVWRNVTARMTSQPPPPRQGEQVLNETPQFSPLRRKFEELHLWRFLSAQDSHGHTEAFHAGLAGLKLTGVPEGRQIWVHDPDAPPPTNVTPNPASPASQRQRRASGSAAAAALADDGLAFSAAENPNAADRLFRARQTDKWEEEGNALPDRTRRPTNVLDAARKATAFYEMLQCDDGHFAGDYGGPHFLMPGLIVVWYVTGQSEAFLSAAHRRAMSHYLRCHQQTDGGWGTHIESPSTMMGTVLSYVSLRLLGADKDDDAMRHGREFMKAHGGAVYTASWAKFYLCVLGVMDWDGHNSTPVEMFMLPDWLPFHPGRLWCHCRMVYLPMAYLYCVRFVYDRAETDPVTMSLREELYEGGVPYAEIPWSATRHLIAECDNYSPVPTTMKVIQNALVLWERYGGPLRRWARGKGLAYAAEYMHAEDLQTNFICIGPVNKVLNMLSAYHVAGNRTDGEDFQRHLMRVPDYLWVAEDGMKMQGYNGSQCWDTSFAVQAISEAGLCEEFPELTARVYSYLERTQILSTPLARESPALAYEAPDCRKRFYRHVSEGGWPFSTSAHGWPISDCSAEGLKATLAIESLPCVAERRNEAPITRERMEKAINVILTLQNTDGGWATYENSRGFGWYEALNPSEVFGDIMIDYCYVECSCASMGALAAFHARFPDHRAAEVRASMNRGRQFLKAIQRDDGSWYGSWACCLTYGTWFGVEGLMMVGERADSEPILRACDFLLGKQNANGGWGEDFTSCYNRSYAPKGMEDYGVGGSGVVPTAWALLALMTARCADTDAVARGVHFLLSQQLEDGDFPQQGISGVFNRACGITYTAYRNVFPIWALGKFARDYAPHFGVSTTAPSASELRRIAAIGSGAATAAGDAADDDVNTLSTRSGRTYVSPPKGPKPGADGAAAADDSAADRAGGAGSRAGAAGTATRGKRKRVQYSFLDRVPSAVYAALCVALPVYALHLVSEAVTDEAAIPVPAHRQNCSADDGNGTNTCPWPDPTHMLYGLLAVAVGQVFTLLYYTVRRLRLCGLRRPQRIQLRYPGEAGANDDELDPYEPHTAEERATLCREIIGHLSRPGGFIILGAYLALSWQLDIMPASYYDTKGAETLGAAFAAVNWLHVLLQLMITDGIMWFMHLGEHKVHPEIYKRSHKPHHAFLSPKLADAFDGSIPDTTLMILIPLVATANLVHANVWSYMAFGSLYGNYLCMIHSEFGHPLDRLLRWLAVGTAADHHVHHRKFVYNYGHIFMLWDRLYGSYIAPESIEEFVGA